MNVLTMAATPAAANPDAIALQRHLKLKDAAERFEGMMLQELLKPMQEGKDGSFGGFGGGFGTSDEDRDDSLDTMGSFGTEAVANAIAKAGGVGIAKQVLREVGALDAEKDSGKYNDNREALGYNKSLKLHNGGLNDHNGSLRDHIGSPRDHIGSLRDHNESPRDHNGSLDEKAEKKS